MSDKQYKMIRKQLKNVVQDILPTILHGESVVALQKELVWRIDGRLDNIAKVMQKTLDQLDERQKDMQAYVVRNIGSVPQSQGGTEAPNQG